MTLNFQKRKLFSVLNCSYFAVSHSTLAAEGLNMQGTERLNANMGLQYWMKNSSLSLSFIAATFDPTRNS